MNDFERRLYNENIFSEFNLIDIKVLPNHVKLEILSLNKINELISTLNNIYFQGFVTICDDVYVVTSERKAGIRMCYFNNKLYTLHGINWKFIFDTIG